MNPLKSPLHRTAAVVAGALIGVAGAAVFAAPASAHHPELAGQTACLSDGGWKVDWTLTPVAPIDGTITNVTPAATTMTKIVKGAPVIVNTPITDTQSFTADDDQAVLTVEVTWIPEARKFDKRKHSNGGYDNEPQPIVKDVTATVPRPDDCEEPEVPPTTPPTTTPPATTPPATTPPATTPPTTPPTESTTPPATPTPTPTFGEAQPIFEITCDSMTIGLDNPADGVEIPLVLAPSTGEKVLLVINPGEKKSHTFQAGEGFSVKIALEGLEDEAEAIAWESPGDCDGSGGGELPLTGVAVGGIAGGAAVLLAVGAGLFFMARRRKVKFTA